MPLPPYKIRPPQAPDVPVLVSIPHTGTYVPEAIAAEFASDYIRSLPMTDWHLHHLYDFLPALGVTTLYATYSRFVADLNRAPDDAPLYPGRFETGCVAVKTFWGDEIYREPPSSEEIGRRRALVHAPYHAQLRALLEAKIARFGWVVLIDAHSVASRASLLHGALQDDVYLGDRDGRSNSGWLTAGVTDAFRWQGLKVAHNNPYKGGYITAHYGQMEQVEALQIEMRWGLYMDEQDWSGALRHPNFPRMKTTLENVFRALLTAVRTHSLT